MKYIIPLLLFTGFLSNCTDSGGTQNLEDLQTVEEIQETLKVKRGELRNLSQQIEQLEARLAEIDPAFAPNATLVAYETIANSNFSNFAQVQATVRAAKTAVASAEIPGRILRMNFEEGDAIRKGQLVAVLDVQGTETQRAELETASDLAKTVFERQQKLWDQNIGSEIQYLQAKNSYDRIQQQLKQVDVQANKANVYAPLSGTVETVTARTGENALPGAPILTIISTGDLDIVADASEDLLTKVNVRDRVKVKVPALNLAFEAPISRIGRTVDQANRTFEVEIDVPREHLNRLKANLLAEVEILDFEGKDLIVVSQDQIQQEIDGRRFVFTVGEGERGPVAKKTYIETGQNYDNKAIVASGLLAGDRIITNGSRGLTDGQPISLSKDPVTNG